MKLLYHQTEWKRYLYFRFFDLYFVFHFTKKAD